MRSYQAEIQEAKAEYFGGARAAAQRYGPPLAGKADTISATAVAVKQLKKDTMIQLIVIVAGPPASKPNMNNVVILENTALKSLVSLINVIIH